MSDKQRKWTRRKTIQSIAGGFGFAATPAAASKARDDRQMTNDDFELKDGELVYEGPETVQLGEAGTVNMREIVAGIKEAERRNEISFEENEGEVTVESLPSAQPDQTIFPPPGGFCRGVSKYRPRGLTNHIICLDSCDTIAVRNKMLIAAAAAELATVIAVAVDAAPVAVVTQIATILFGTAATLLTANNKGQGVCMQFGSTAVFRIRPQR